MITIDLYNDSDRIQKIKKDAEFAAYKRQSESMLSDLQNHSPSIVMHALAFYVFCQVLRKNHSTETDLKLRIEQKSLRELLNTAENYADNIISTYYNEASNDIKQNQVQHLESMQYFVISCIFARKIYPLDIKTDIHKLILQHAIMVAGGGYTQEVEALAQSDPSKGKCQHALEYVMQHTQLSDIYDHQSVLYAAKNVIAYWKNDHSYIFSEYCNDKQDLEWLGIQKAHIDHANNIQ